MKDGDRPLVDADFDRKDVIKLCEKRGLLNPCYTWRTNCSCFCCPFQRKQDWLNLAEHHPDLFALAEDWEYWSNENSNSGGFNWNDGFSLKQLREATEQQVKLFPECTDEACTICQW
jgi:hypothetical protein